MAETTTQRSLRPDPGSQPTVGNPASGRVRATSFKYYIHDSCAELRLKLIGEMTQADVPELNGCWHTAKTTLGRRKLVLDVRSLRMIDESARDWLAEISGAGACCVPDDFLATCVPGQRLAEPETVPATGKMRLFGRLAALFRGTAVSTAESSTTRAQ